MPATATEITMEITADDFPDASYLEQEGFEDRLRQYHDGQFGFIGVSATCTVKIPHGDHFILQHISSPGLWGIEDDSGHDYINSVYEDECAILRDMLAELGITLQGRN